MIRRVWSQFADFPRLGPTPASSDEVGCSAANRNVGGSNPPRGANSFVIQPVADIFRKFGHSTIRCRCANHDQSRSIKTNENQLRQVSLRFVRSIAANRDQTKHSARDRMLVRARRDGTAHLLELQILTFDYLWPHERCHKNVPARKLHCQRCGCPGDLAPKSLGTVSFTSSPASRSWSISGN
jgi:hypothetical protein